MDNSKITGRVFSQTTSGRKLDNGLWELTVDITEKLFFPDGTEKEESINTMCADEDFDVAHQIALHSALIELRELVYDKNLDSLIDGKEQQRKLEAENDSIKADQDTPTQ